MKRLTSIFIGFLAFAFGGCKETPPAPPTVGPTQLATPAVTLGAITPTTAAFSWKKVENADGYEYTIKREETTVVSQKVPDDETEAVAEGLESETSYTLALRALGNNEYEDSSWREISFTTRADEPEPPSHVAIPDKVLEKYLFDNGIDIDSDGIISFDEAAAFTAIEMGYDYAEDATDANTVKSLDGLQYFTALETLNLKFHRVTDTAPIEGLTNLRALNLGENPITALRLDQLGQLTDLRLYGTGISELNLSKTPEMTVLYLQRTALTDLDLSVLPKLENAYINEARLTSLRAVGLDNLVRLDADGNRTILETLEEGGVFGEVLAFSGAGGDSIFLECRRDCRVLYLDYDQITKRCENACLHHSILVQNLFRLLSTKTLRLSERVEVLSRRSIREKLLCYFEQLARREKSDTVTLPFSLSALAEYISADRSAMMRELKKLKEEGVVQTENRRVTILP